MVESYLSKGPERSGVTPKRCNGVHNGRHEVVAPEKRDQFSGLEVVNRETVNNQSRFLKSLEVELVP